MEGVHREPSGGRLARRQLGGKDEKRDDASRLVARREGVIVRNATTVFRQDGVVGILAPQVRSSRVQETVGDVEEHAIHSPFDLGCDPLARVQVVLVDCGDALTKDDR